MNSDSPSLFSRLLAPNDLVLFISHLVNGFLYDY